MVVNTSCNSVVIIKISMLVLSVNIFRLFTHTHTHMYVLICIYTYPYIPTHKHSGEDGTISIISDETCGG